MTNCDWTALVAGGTCRQCGYVLRRDYAAPPKRNCETPPANNRSCPHLLDPTGESVRVFGCGCPAERAAGFDAATYGCELFSVCLPRYKATRLSRDVRLCVHCVHNPTR